MESSWTYFTVVGLGLVVYVSLPLHIRSSDSLATFQSRLKSHLFASAYHV